MTAPGCTWCSLADRFFVGGVNIHGHQVRAGRHNGVVYIVMRDVCEALGVSWHRQLSKLSEGANQYMSCLMLTDASSAPTGGGGQRALAIPLYKFRRWCMSVNENKVKPEIRERFDEWQLIEGAKQLLCVDINTQNTQNQHERTAPQMDQLIHPLHRLFAD